MPADRAPPAARICRRALFLCYLLLLVWAPLPLGSNRPWSLGLLEVWVFALGALGLLGWALKPWPLPPALRKHWPVPGLLLLWLAYLWLQMLPMPASLLASIAPVNAAWWQNLSPAVDAAAVTLAADRGVAFSEFLRQCAYVVFFCLTLVLVDSDRRLGMVTFVMIGTATFEATYGLAAHFMRDSFPFWTPTWYGHQWASGTFVNKNHFGANLSFGIALTLGACLAFLADRPYIPGWWRPRLMVEQVSSALLEPGYFRFGILLVLLTALFFSQSRGAFLALAVAGFVGLVFGACWRDERGSSGAPSAERRILPGLLLIAVVAAVWLSVSGLFARLLPSELVDMGRLVTWRQTFAMWQDHWLFGVGNGSFQYVFTAYRVPELDGDLYDFAHNDHLQLLAEQGVIGATLFFATFSLCWWRMLAAYGARGGSGRSRGILLGILIAVTSFFLHGFVDFNFHIPANALWFYALLALGLVSSAR